MYLNPVPKAPHSHKTPPRRGMSIIEIGLQQSRTGILDLDRGSVADGSVICFGHRERKLLNPISNVSRNHFDRNNAIYYVA